MTSDAPLRTGPLIAVLLTALFMMQADATIVNVANPSIHADLHASGAALELVVGGYMVAFATLLITGARVGQMHGYRRAFLGGLAVFTVASLGCGLAPTPIVLVVARVVQGAGAALMVPQVLTSIQVHLDGPDRVRALGLYSAALAGGAVAGQALGGLLVSANLLGSQWRPIFLINVPVGVAVLVSGRQFLPSDRGDGGSERIDTPGVATLAGALALVVLALTLGRQEGWPAWTWACLIASVPLAAAFVAIERRVAARGGAPLVNLHVITRPPIAWGITAQALATSTYYALLFTLALYLQQGLGRSPLTSGLTLLAWVAAFGVPGRLLPRVPARVRRLGIPVGCLILAGAHAAVSVAAFSGVSAEGLLVPLLGLGGFGLGTTFSTVISHLTEAATPRYAPDISGVFTTCVQLAGVIGIAVFGTVYLGLADHPGPANATHAFAIVTAAFAGLALLAAGAAYRAIRADRETDAAARAAGVATAVGEARGGTGDPA
jgi:MFS family permease